MNMNRGVIFSYDAIMAISIVILLFSAISITGYAGENDGNTRAALYLKASELADQNFLRGGNGTDSPTAANAGCAEVFDYNSQQVMGPKVRKCVQSG